MNVKEINELETAEIKNKVRELNERFLNNI